MAKPFIKWPGGKGAEIGQILPLIPEYDRYIEPFVGGGALYFALEPENAVINDLSDGLMEIYELVRARDLELRRLLGLYCTSFGALKQQCRKNAGLLSDLFALYDTAEEKGLDIRSIAPHLTVTERIACSEEVLCELILDREEYLSVMYAAVEDKFRRTAKNNRKKAFSDADLQENLLTGFTSGFYLYFRGVFNQIASRSILPTRQYRAANFYFVREYCYGAMFRYNRDGDFNIPYGGMTYNKKDLDRKIERMFRPETGKLLRRTQLYSMDFQELLEHLDLTERDFVFLDPPYDTDFSEYDGRAFAREDHERLAAFLYETRAQFVMVIKNTDFIYSLYKDRFRILRFDSRYSYNVRSRNERRSEHLIITNVPEDTVPWIRENIYSL